jgi:hypothetical protein
MSLLAAAQIGERYDLAVMSTKGMSVTVARELLDRLTPQLDCVFVLHDFDISGFSILGTLGEDGPRYAFKNEVPIIDLGLWGDGVCIRGDDARAFRGADRHAPRARRHAQEIKFLEDRRVELNAMASREFIDFIESKLEEHGLEKLVPDADIIEAQARQVIERQLTEEALAGMRDEIARQAAMTELPEDLRQLVEAELQEDPNPVLGCRGRVCAGCAVGGPWPSGCHQSFQHPCIGC